MGENVRETELQQQENKKFTNLEAFIVNFSINHYENYLCLITMNHSIHYEHLIAILFTNL